MSFALAVGVGAGAGACRGCDETARGVADGGAATSEAETSILVDRFDAPGLDATKWAFVREGDMREAAVSTRDGKLWLEMETVGATPGTMKTVGVRTAKAIDVGRGAVIELTLYWDALELKALARAGIAVSTDGSGRAPMSLTEALMFECIGLPDPKVSRFQVATQRGGNFTQIEGEGWPERRGRPIGRLDLWLYLDSKQFALKEAGREVVRREGYGFAMERVYVYLTFASAPGYPMRGVGFGNVRIRPALLSDWTKSN
ncbi:MAG: hypothetical protein HYY84_16905 [Deltaproteobacteria bacterium]|nr:hypothetical protein [Deltaproteobacteria bacterium]